MRAALIPPRGLERWALMSDFHMVLPIRKTMCNSKYVQVYKEAAVRGDYIIMDNGAADGGLVDYVPFIDAAKQIEPKELVAPDVLFGTETTLSLVKRFLIMLEAEQLLERFTIQAVAQGRDEGGFRKCIEAYANEPLIKVVGLPKHMLTTIDQLPARINMANWIELEFPGRFEIHMLGTSPEWLGELRSIKRYASHVRSVDSALPFNYAIHGENLSITTRRIMRHPDYFNHNWDSHHSSLIANNVYSNVYTYMDWAGAGEPFPS